MTDQLAQGRQPAVKDWSEQLRALVDNAPSLDELQEQLLQLAPEHRAWINTRPPWRSACRQRTGWTY
ncbi:hypothetical protein P4204_07730 [Pseudomonas aeruginosa]|nr:hypothetical protein [Pseudomonas aeruginosa]